MEGLKEGPTFAQADPALLGSGGRRKQTLWHRKN